MSAAVLRPATGKPTDCPRPAVVSPPECLCRVPVNPKGCLRPVKLPAPGGGLYGQPAQWSKKMPPQIGRGFGQTTKNRLSEPVKAGRRRFFIGTARQRERLFPNKRIIFKICACREEKEADPGSRLLCSICRVPVLDGRNQSSTSSASMPFLASGRLSPCLTNSIVTKLAATKKVA